MEKFEIKNSVFKTPIPKIENVFTNDLSAFLKYKYVNVDTIFYLKVKPVNFNKKVFYFKL